MLCNASAKSYYVKARLKVWVFKDFFPFFGKVPLWASAWCCNVSIVAELWSFLNEAAVLFCCCMNSCFLMTAEAESFERWLDRPTEDVGYQTESVHTEQQAACECLLYSLWICCFATILVETQHRDADKLMLGTCPLAFCRPVLVCL